MTGKGLFTLMEFLKARHDRTGIFRTKRPLVAACLSCLYFWVWDETQGSAPGTNTLSMVGMVEPSLSPSWGQPRPPDGPFALSRSVSFHRLLYRSGGTFPSKQLTNQQGDLMLKTCIGETGSFKQTLHADTPCVQTSIADHVTLSLEWTAILCVPATTLWCDPQRLLYLSWNWLAWSC